MPGIVGLVTKRPAPEALRSLQGMVTALCHESFYTTGTWADESLGVYVGWAERGATTQPIYSARQDLVLAFSGEDISDLGCADHSRSYLLGQSQSDPRFPARLNGRFHGLLVDRAQRTATLFNDRYGMHRLYYYEAKDAFYFAAEAKAILAVCPELRTIDPRSLGEFIACGCVLGNRSLFTNVRLLPAAATWVFVDGSLRHRRTYFEPREWEQQEPLDAESYYREIRDAFASSLPRYFCSREPIGIALTGGLDTRMIMAWRKAAPNSLRCYTFGGMFRESHDVRVARRVAELCHQRHDVISVGDEFLGNFPRYAERSVYLTDGCADVSRSSDLYVSEHARRIAPVKIVGTYGSEILTQVPTFKPARPVPGLFSPDVQPALQTAEASYAELRREHPVTFAAFRQSPWSHYGVLSLEQTQLSVRSPYLDNEFVRTVFRAPRSGQGNDDIRLRMINEGSDELGRIRTDRGVGGGQGGGVPALRRGLREFTFKADHAFDYAMPQWLARIEHRLAPLHLERIFLGRHKLLHFRIWYQKALAGYVRDMLLDPRALSRSYVDRRGVESVVRGHLEGGRNFTSEIHKLVTLELVHRLFVETR